MPTATQPSPYQPSPVSGTRMDYEHFHDDPLYQAARKRIIMRSLSSRALAFVAVASLAIGLVGVGLLASHAVLGIGLLLGGVAGATIAGYKSWQHSLDVEFGPTDVRSRLRSQNLAHSFQPILQQQQGYAQNQRADGQSWSAVVSNDGAQPGRLQGR